jgi:hypothetical protein
LLHELTYPSRSKDHLTMTRSQLFFVVFLCLPFAVSAIDPVAVNQLTSSGVSKSEAVSLTDALRSDLTKTGKFQVMERGQMEQILKEQGFQASGACDEASCAIEMGKILSVNQIVLGNIGKVGQTYTLNVRLVEVGTGKIVRDVTEYHKGSPDGLLTKIIPIITAKLSGTYKAPSKTPIFIAAGGIAVVAIAVPVIYFATKAPADQPAADAGSTLRVGW